MKNETEEKSANIIPHSGSTPDQRVEHSNIITEAVAGMVLLIEDKEKNNGG